MIPRDAGKLIKKLAGGYSVIAITGPRQSGKTTLAKHLFPKKPYVSLENPDTREWATNDPRAFLGKYSGGAVFDEIQRAPELFSYLQEIVDNEKDPGRFIITGSQQFGLMSTITQSLAGRVALVQLLPFALHELYSGGVPAELDRVLFNGLYPPVHDRNLEPRLWYANYMQTYIERDVRQIVNVKDLSTFQRFVRLCAGRVGQLVNFSDLASDCGISHNTIRAWLSILEASYIVFLLQPHFENFNKRIIKTPKLYFYDSGLLCWLLSVSGPDELSTHSGRGAIFESFIISEYIKSRFNDGLTMDAYFWRDRSGNEIDLLLEKADRLLPVEIKSGMTMNTDFFRGLKSWTGLAGAKARHPTLVYGGEESISSSGIRVFSWKDRSLFGSLRNKR